MLLDEALTLDEAGRRRWLEAVAPQLQVDAASMRHLIEKELGPVHILVAKAGREKLAGEKPALKTPARGPCASGLLRIHEMACN